MPLDDSERITDARVLRAMAHPLRVKILNALALMDTATATQIAEAVGDTPANCSWHMRQLAKYGFIEEAPGGTGRNRPWRMIVEPRSWGGPGDDAELTLAGHAAIDVLLDYEVQQLRAWQRNESREPDEWRQVSGMGQSVQWMTAAELAEFNEVINEMFRRHLDRLSDPSKRPEGARPIRFVAWSVPAMPLASAPSAQPLAPSDSAAPHAASAPESAQPHAAATPDQLQPHAAATPEGEESA
jgi:DNA-binding transcriptional ArsR family regulator